MVHAKDSENIDENDKYGISNDIKFTKANFSEDGLTIQDVITRRCLGLRGNSLICNIKNIFFSFDGKENIFNKINLNMKYSLNWDVSIEKMRIFDECFEIYDFQVQNNKTFFIKTRKISNIGKISALDFNSGYSEPMGWKFNSKMMTYKDGAIFFLGNNIGFGKIKLAFFDLNFNKRNTSGFLLNPCFNKDFSDYRYLAFGYYYLSKDEKFDFTIYPMLYFKDLGLNFEIRDLVHNIEVSIQAERGGSYLINKLRNKKEKKNDRNIIVCCKANNGVIDADFHIFNQSFYNQNIWQSMNYQNFLLLDKDYWGYLYLNLGKLNLACLERNHEKTLRANLEITKFLKIKGERSFEGKTTADIILPKKYFGDLDLFLIDWSGELKYTFFKDENVLKLNIDNLTVKSGVKIDLPMIFLSDNLLRLSVSFNVGGEFLDFFKFALKKINTNNQYKLHGVIQPKMNIEGVLDTEHFDAKFFIKDSFNFGVELSNLGNFSEYFDSFAVEKKDDKFYLCFLFLKPSRSYGLKLSSNQFLLEFLITLNECIKFKFLGSYFFKDKFFKVENFQDKNTYINFGIEFMTQSWQMSFGYGIRNTLTNVGTSSLYYISIAPKIQLSFEEIEQIFKDLELEKAKILSLYDDFK